MFQPNSIGQLKRRTGRDVHGRGIFADPVDIAFAPVSFNVESIKTAVRADSSATRGAADQLDMNAGRILVDKAETIAIGDHFLFDGLTFNVTRRFARRSVLGDLDHIQCELTLWPDV